MDVRKGGDEKRGKRDKERKQVYKKRREGEVTGEGKGAKM